MGVQRTGSSTRNRAAKRIAPGFYRQFLPMSGVSLWLEAKAGRLLPVLPRQPDLDLGDVFRVNSDDATAGRSFLLESKEDPRRDSPGDGRHDYLAGDVNVDLRHVTGRRVLLHLLKGASNGPPEPIVGAWIRHGGRILDEGVLATVRSSD